MPVKIAEILVEILNDRLGISNNAKAAKALGVQASNLSSYRNLVDPGKTATKRMIIRLAKAIAKQDSLNTMQLLDNIVREKFKKNSSREVASVLGIAKNSRDTYKSTNSAKEVTVKKAIIRAMEKYEEQMIASSLKPLCEYHKITLDKTSKGFSIRQSNSNKSFRTKVENRNGIYIYFDSRCRAFYVGKAQKTELFTEIENRTKKKITVRASKVGPKSLLQGEVLSFISAYEVTPPSLIPKLEAILIRVFKNDLTNHKVESL